MSSSSSDRAFGTMSPSRYASIRINERDGITGSDGSISSHHSPKHEDYKTSHDLPSHSTLSKDKELECTDLNTDCTQQTCKNYPFTAKTRCAKTCGFCRKQATDSSSTTTYTGSRHSSFTTDKQKSKTSSEFDRSDSSWRGKKPTISNEDCKDEESHCSEHSCLDYPHHARTKCAKTCGFCGSIIDLKPPTVDSSDKGSVITLDDDNIGSSSIRSTATTRHRWDSGIDIVTSTQKSRHSSISSRTDSIRKPSSATAHIQQPTYKPSLGDLRRYPGRTGPCADENHYCEKGDCHRYPRFAQRYCEKTCNYC
ncbi:hypothetical protein LOAG_17826 [Loa loa]|uniref:ShKT domain-containing protein n=1 Tax=Loa loa TaxID=7209 RepID=A0A1S0UHJ5_LOALO|nr:hypothetical protein LOAG_17826 [Loa loa]EJD74931.1 hypothetical protein LOAG_17826 [Loa loa]